MRHRQGFTLVELLVTMALIIFIMAILSQAFVAATQVFRDLKSAGDMAEKLRATSGLMRRYLAADHFEGKRRLSDPNFWAAGPPREGFFRLYQGSPSTFEGTDLDGNPSFRSVNHALHFTVKLRGNQRGDFFTASVPSGSPLPALGLPEGRYEDSGNTYYNWQWAEVVFFLKSTGDSANGTPLFSLYMRQLLTVPDNSLVRPVQPASQQLSYLEVSAQPDPTNNANLYFNSAADLTMPVRRFAMTAGDLGGTPTGNPYPTFADQGTTDPNLLAADLLLTDVISFDVRLLLAQPPNPGQKGPAPYPNTANWDLFEDLFQITNAGRLPTSYPVNNPDFSTSGPLVFDTWSAARDDSYDYTSWSTAGTKASIPIYNDAKGDPISVRAIQVTLRIWDNKAQQTRQITFVQAL